MMLGELLGFSVQRHGSLLISVGSTDLSIAALEKTTTGRLYKYVQVQGMQQRTALQVTSQELSMRNGQTPMARWPLYHHPPTVTSSRLRSTHSHVHAPGPAGVEGGFVCRWDAEIY